MSSSQNLLPLPWNPNLTVRTSFSPRSRVSPLPPINPNSPQSHRFPLKSHWYQSSNLHKKISLSFSFDWISMLFCVWLIWIKLKEIRFQIRIQTRMQWRTLLRHSWARPMTWWTILRRMRSSRGAPATTVLWFGIRPSLLGTFFLSISSTTTSPASYDSWIHM